MKPTAAERIGHINEAIDTIRRGVHGHTLVTFTDDTILRAAVERLLGNISEASRHIPDDLKSEAHEINWRRLADLGNWLRHAYHRTDAGLLWTMVEEDLEPLKSFVARHTQIK
ncbi:DUF86 domain-containing protein [Tardiphaga sp. 709]|uniref:HepT-like ribonuclease domain-containing protein n=1 Tax=Tardiphaga sp. 709 TaxID=3076039 RepID=UPI0028EE3B87|nr:HepT-like ribonuclease domain-containing protein [Tardiphaga sp. 709]WNV09295.1 HepT-like ribonuclease domain-containing protein [Tardiphaga sp. 709]